MFRLNSICFTQLLRWLSSGSWVFSSRKRLPRFPKLIFSISPSLVPRLSVLTRCASHRAPCWLRGALPPRRQVRSKLSPISLAGNQECPPPSPPPSPPPLSSFPNGSYQTHQETRDRTVLRPWEGHHQLAQRLRLMCKCFASVLPARRMPHWYSDFR